MAGEPGKIHMLARNIFAIPVDGGGLIIGRITTTASDGETGGSKRSKDRKTSKGAVGCGCVFALIWAAMSIYFIVVGQQECPIEELIKTYVIVQGIFNLIQVIFFSAMGCAFSKDNENWSICLSICNIVLAVFLLAWTITGSVWVWKSVGDWQDDHSVCNNTLIISAMVCLSLHYLLIIVACCCCVGAICFMCSDDSC